MGYIVQDQEVVLTHWPGKVAWTYHLLIPNAKHIVGTWGNIKVSGTLDNYAFHAKNLAPIAGGNKILAVNAAVRRRLGKQAGDWVRVTMYREVAAAPGAEAEVPACLEDAGVLPRFKRILAFIARLARYQKQQPVPLLTDAFDPHFCQQAGYKKPVSAPPPAIRVPRWQKLASFISFLTKLPGR